MSDLDMRVIYTGCYVADLAVCEEYGHPMRNWLFFRHPDGQWVSLAPLDFLRKDGRRLALEEAACLVDQHDSGEILHTDLAHAIRALAKQ